MTLEKKIESFLAAPRFAVVDASRDRAKYGNKVLRVYQQNNLDVVPVNPHAGEVEELSEKEKYKLAFFASECLKRLYGQNYHADGRSDALFNL